ncbi:MAG: alpha-galactosidase [bacterium]|nr:alpha-galactosidase [bacterium]
MIQNNNNLFHLQTESTSYVFRVNEKNHLEHLYYGEKIAIEGDAMALQSKDCFIMGNLIAYEQEDKQYSLSQLCLEASGLGKGDIREPFVELIFANGSRTTDFLFEKAEVRKKEALTVLPSSYDESGETEELVISLKDRNHHVRLELCYGVFYQTNVITRSARLINEGNEVITVSRLLSAQLDFETNEYVFTNFCGSWGREMKRYNHELHQGKVVNASRAGVSSNRNNPFVMLSELGTTEDFGSCYGMNLIYSGNHYEAAEVSELGQVRLVSGINPEGFTYELQPEAVFQAPEAVMTYSSLGMNGMSQNMHHFVKEHIVRGEWKKKERPILLNSWEAAYFKINESKLVKMAKAAKDAGIELFVMDDGWFGNRNDDTSSLGDWFVNEKKLPGGLKGIADKINGLGLDFGIWVEPEMICADSDLFRLHPDWAVRIEGQSHSEGRNQMFLDLTKDDVCNYVIKVMSRIFESANISYVKWDMNRIFTDLYSDTLSAHRQGEFGYRYNMGLYKVLEALMSKFPHILFEGCASGGNRFDLGMLCYFPQIWASDDTDGYERATIQTGYSYGYPMSVVTAHVSGCPNHQTLRTVPLETRFNVAAFGVLGYECNLLEATKEELDAIKAQVALYKEYRGVLQFGDYYRIANGDDTDYRNGVYQWITVSEDKETAVGLYMQNRVTPNYSYARFKAKGLDPEYTYVFTNRTLKYNIKEFGDLVNTVAPIHIKKDSLGHNMLAKFIKMDGEQECYTVKGSLLNNAGIRLKQGFAATGYSDQVRFFQDYSSRIYFMNKK